MTAAVNTFPALLEATAPPERRGIERDAVQMLVTDRQTRRHSHMHFFDLPAVLRDGDLLVVNDSATLPAAIQARRQSGQSLALHVSTKMDEHLWMAEPRGSVSAGESLLLPGGGSAVMLWPVEPKRPRVWYAAFNLPLAMNAYLMTFGEPIRYGYMRERFPLEDYQTIFAREPGSSEMPSAARPFTSRIVNALQQRGVERATITLHCGVASFETPERPSIERYVVSLEAAAAVNRARAEGRRVIAVGSTSLRALESALADGEIIASSGWTDLVIDEQSKVKSVDGLLTGFHDGASTHQWMLRAFLDRELLASAYDEAAERGYYQHEFGDIHLIV